MKILLLSAIGTVNNAVNGFVQWIYSLLYQILMWIKDIFDFCYILVRKLAGLDTYYYNGIEMNGSDNTSITGDIIEMLIRSDVVMNLFISLLVLGIILLLIVTFINIWKTEWSSFDKETNSKTKIANTSLKALFNFIAVPTIAFLGIIVGNALLGAINSATGAGKDALMSDIIMSSLHTNAVRSDNQSSTINLTVVTNNQDYNEEEQKYGIFRYFTNNLGEVDSMKVLTAFKENWKITNKGKYFVDAEGLNIDEAALNRKLDEGTLIFSFEDNDLVALFFDNQKVNYIVGYLVLITMTTTMLMITYGLVKRLFYVLILFIVSPPIVAMSPINGKIMDGWRSLFIGNLAMAYITIAIYNIFMSIYPLFDKIAFFPAEHSILNTFVSLLIVCVGLITINDLQAKISALFIGNGNDVYSNSTDKGNSLWNGAFGMAGKALKPATLPVKAAGKVATFANTAVHKGMGAALQEAKDGTVGSIKKTAGNLATKGPLNDMWSNMSVMKKDPKSGNVEFTGGIGDFVKIAKENKKMDNGTTETLSGIKKAVKNDMNSTAQALGIETKDLKTVIQQLENDENLQSYNRNTATVSKFKKGVEDGTIKEGTEEYKQYKEAEAALQAMENKDKLALQSKLLSTYQDYQTLNKPGMALKLMKENNQIPLSDNDQELVKQAKAVMSNRLATEDAVNEQTLNEQIKRFNEIQAKQAKGADTNVLRNEYAALKAELVKITHNTANTQEIEDLRKKIDSILKKLDKK